MLRLSILSKTEMNRTDGDPENSLGADVALEQSISVFSFPDYPFTFS